MTKLAMFDRRRFLTGLFGGLLSLGTLPAGASQRGRTVLIQRSPLAGFQYHQGEAVWSELHTGDALKLVREAANAYDHRAVRVDWHGHKLGYVPRRENTAVAQMLDRGEPLEAHITRLGEGPNPWDRIRFDVRLAG